MEKKKRFIFLTDKFYEDYPHDKYSEIEQKPTRPYIQVVVEIEGVQFAVPLRSDINHPHVLWTDKPNHCGVDFSKAVVITDAEKYIDYQKDPYIRPSEFDALRGKDYKIKEKMIRYIADYKDAKNNLSDPIKQKLYEYSTLQYFEKYIYKADKRDD